MGTCAKAPAIVNAVMAAAALPIKIPLLMIASSVAVDRLRGNPAFVAMFRCAGLKHRRILQEALKLFFRSTMQGRRSFSLRGWNLRAAIF